MQTILEFEKPPEIDNTAGAALKWIYRCYETMDEWKSKATKLFFSLNGDSAATCNRLALELRRYFESGPKPEDVKNWNKDFSVVETVHATPPKITASNSAYV